MSYHNNKFSWRNIKISIFFWFKKYLLDTRTPIPVPAPNPSPHFRNQSVIDRGQTSVSLTSIYSSDILVYPLLILYRIFKIHHKRHNSRSGTCFDRKVFIFFLFLHENISVHCGYSLEGLCKALLMSTYDMFSWKNKKYIFQVSLHILSYAFSSDHYFHFFDSSQTGHLHFHKISSLIPLKNKKKSESHLLLLWKGWLFH